MSREFRRLRQEELPIMFQMILDRMAWMDRRGIRQWNVTEYDKVYPLSYYEQLRQRGELFGLMENGRLLCAGALMERCERWSDNESAMYLRHLVSALDAKGTGTDFMDCAEAFARTQGKRWFRLDSAVDNEPLAAWYESMGYGAVGTCVDGPYEGTLREKRL